RTGAKVVKARRVRTGADVAGLAAFHTAYHLLDAYQPDRWGGTGQTFDWELVAARRTDVPVILSGGLTHENVAEAIEATRPFAVDVASGSEARPRREDPDQLRRVAAAVPAANAAAHLPSSPAQPSRT